MKSRVLPVLVVLAAAAAMISAQQSKSFRTEISYVELHVSVTTKSGQRVHGLTKADFQVRESKTPQTIESVDEISLPMPPPRDVHALEPDASVSDTGLGDDGRLYVVVIDRGHLDAENTPKLRRQLAEFIDDFVAPADRVAVVNLGSSNVTPFTSNKTRLRAGLGLLSAYRTPADSSDLKVPEGNGDKDGLVAESIAENIAALAADETARDATAAAGSFDSMVALAKYLRGFEGRRKSVVYVSGGTDVSSPQPGAAPASSASAGAAANAFQRMVDALQASNITVYSIDPNGLSRFDPYDGGGSQTPLSSGFGPKSVAPVAMMRALADDTGGFPVVGFNDLTKPFARIVEDNSDYYVIGYSSNRPTDGKSHVIEVRVPGRDVEVRARGRIEAASPKSKSNAVDEAWRKTDVASLLARPVPTADPGLRIRLTASPIAWRADKAVVQLALEIHEGEIPLKPSPAGFANEIVAAFQAFDVNGALKAAKSETITLRVRPETRDAIRDKGWRYVTEFELPRGLYQLRVAASESNERKSGSAFLDLAIPDPRKEPLSLIGVALASNSARLIPTAGSAPTLRKGGPLVVTGSRSFDQSETLTALVAVADNIAGDHEVKLSASLVNADGRIAKEVGGAIASTALKSSESPRAIEIPLTGVPPGSYSVVMRAEAAGKSARRSLVIAVK